MGSKKMTGTIKRLQQQMVQVMFLAVLVSWLPLTAADLPPSVKQVDKRPARKQWQVKYMGGTNPLKRGTRVYLEISEEAIAYRTAGGGKGGEFSIPGGSVSDVSAEVIEGDLSEKLFAPDYPDYLDDLGVPCVAWTDRSIPDPRAAVPVASGCFAGSLGLEVPYAIVASVLSTIHFKDHFIRLRWEQEGTDPEAVFKVSGKDYLALQEALESITDEARKGKSQEQSSEATAYDRPQTHIENFERKTHDMHIRQWLTEQCASTSADKPAWLRPSSGLAGITSLCSPNLQDGGRSLLLAK
jgi:hypothetical protein